MHTGPKSFQQAVDGDQLRSSTGPTSTPSTSPTSSPGWYPQRAQGHLAGLPGPRHRRVRLAGLRPRAAHGETGCRFAKHPHAVDQRYLVSWNNKQAPGWAAADDKYAYGPLHRSQMISDQVKAATQGRRKMTLAQLVQAMEEPATQDLRGVRLLPILLQGDGQAEARRARGTRCATLRAWHRAGAHRRDLDRDGAYERRRARSTLMDAWWPKLVEAQFRPALGGEAFEQLRRDARRPASHTRRLARRARLLRRLVGLRPQGPARRSSGRATSAALDPRLLRRRLEAQCRSGAAAARCAQALEGDAASSSTAAATAPPTRSPPAST